MLASLLEAVGWKVTREYYINDAGAQVDVLAWSAYVRYLEALGEPQDAAVLEGLYPGDYLIETGRILAGRYGTTLNRPSATVSLAVCRCRRLSWRSALSSLKG